MDKKDIYEHLAKIYLDASSKRKKKSKDYSRVFKNLFFISVAFIFGLSIFLATRLNQNKSLNSSIALILNPDVVKLNFNFNPAKKEIYSAQLDKLNLSRFQRLEFEARKVNVKDKINLRVEFTSRFKEKSEIYIRDIPYKWQNYKIRFSEFKGISDWTQIASLAFIVEEWNVKEKTGILYIDNIRLLR